jgi:hypothetical protein
MEKKSTTEKHIDERLKSLEDTYNINRNRLDVLRTEVAQREESNIGLKHRISELQDLKVALKKKAKGNEDVPMDKLLESGSRGKPKDEVSTTEKNG